MQYFGRIKDSLDDLWMALVHDCNPRIEVSNLRYLQSVLAIVTFLWYSLQTYLQKIRQIEACISPKIAVALIK